jgi:hypothetical protein
MGACGLQSGELIVTSSLVVKVLGHGPGR